MSKLHVSSDYLPDSITNQFTKLDFMVSKYMFRGFRVRREVICYDKMHVSPALKTIAATIGASIYAVSRSLNRLHKLRVFRITRTRKSDGTYFLNKYSLGDAVRNIMSTFKNVVKGIKNLHLRQDATVLNSRQHEDNVFEHIGHISDVLDGKMTVEECLAVVKRL